MMSGKIYDITPTLSPQLAVYPGDLPFSCQQATDNGVMVTDIHTTLHIGAHIDAPLHCMPNAAAITQLELSYFVGSCQVVKLSLPPKYEMTPKDFRDIAITESRVLIATGTYSPTTWSDGYAALSPDLVSFFHAKGVILIGIDTPSVDLYTAQDMPSHRRMAELGVIGLEGLCLSDVEAGRYQLIALPLKLQGLEASPVRAILIKE